MVTRTFYLLTSVGYGQEYSSGSLYFIPDTVSQRICYQNTKANKQEIESKYNWQ